MSRPEPAPRATVSVVISTLDRPRTLTRCLDALLTGTCLPEEIVVVDQGDATMTTEVLAAHREGGVRLVHVRQERRGLSASQNAGVLHARCPAVAVVDDDCVPDERWVEVAAREHSAAANGLLVTGRVLPLPATGDRTLALSSRTSLEREVLPPTAPPWRIGTGGNFTITRSAYLAVGGNDERLGTGAPGRAGNDLDLFHRLQRAGVEVRYEPDLLVLHERARPVEHRARRWTYGFGVGACVMAWLRDGDLSALRTLAAWILLRAKRLGRARRPGVVLDEGRVLLGTAAGMWHGARMGPRRPGAGPPP